MATEDTFDLERFLKMQERDYATALEEMKRGHKESHWIWYIFPQMRGLGHSDYSWIYGIADLEEAKAYLTHPVLGQRLREITKAVLAHEGEDIFQIMGSGIDGRKLRSSMTLLDAISPNDIFAQVLNSFFGGKRDRKTLRKIGRMG